MNRADPAPLLVGDEDGDHLRLGVDPATELGSGWLAIVAEVRAGGLAGRVVGALEPAALAAFRDAVAALAGAPRGRSALVAPDGFLAVRMLGDGLGHFDARCELRDLAAIGSRLELTIGDDGRDLPRVVAALDAVIAAAAR